MAQEPPSKENPLFGEPNAYLTPHIAWVEGILTAYDEESITITIDDEDIVIARKDISMIRLAFV